MNRKLSLVLMALAIFLFACGGEETSGPVDLTGSWSFDSGDPDFLMSAVVDNEEMIITWHGSDFRALYWKGDIPEVLANGATFISNGDTDAMDMSLLGSLLENKEFTYRDSQIIFDLEVFGVTQTIRMDRD